MYTHMCVYIYMYVCMYVYISLCLYICIYTHYILATYSPNFCKKTFAAPPFRRFAIRGLGREILYTTTSWKRHLRLRLYQNRDKSFYTPPPLGGGGGV